MSQNELIHKIEEFVNQYDVSDKDKAWVFEFLSCYYSMKLSGKTGRISTLPLREGQYETPCSKR